MTTRTPATLIPLARLLARSLYPPHLPRHESILPRWPALLTLCALWLFACFFMLGDLGYWNDDYFINSRNPATGEPFRYIMDRMTPFDPAGDPVLTWRPLYNITLGSITALFWHAPWVMHLIGALAHLATTLALWRLLTLLGRTPHGALAGAALFCCYPVAFEAIFWTCAIPTALSTCCYIIATCFFIAWTQSNTRRSLLAAIFFAALVPCFNEQAAAGIAAWPFLYLACRNTSERTSRSLARLTTILTPIAFLHAGYIAMMVLSKRADGGLGAAGQLLPPREWINNFLRISPHLEDMHKWSFLGTAALHTGLDALRDMPLRAALMLAAIAAACALTARAWTTPADEPGPLATHNDLAANPAARRLAVLAFALTLGAITLLPLIVVTDTAVRPRMAHITTVALAVLVALALDRLFALARRTHTHKPASIAIALPLLAALAVCSLSLIGTQRAYHLRQRMDDHIAAQLRELVPNPAPGAVFMPLRAADLPTNTGHHGFDTYFIGPWYHSSAYPSIAQHTYRRPDIDSTYFSFTAPTIVNADATGLRFFGPMLATFKPDTWPNQPASEPLVPGRRDFSPWIAWERVIPFTISREGEVKLVTQIAVERSGEEVVQIAPPRSQHAPPLAVTVQIP